jgi:formylglycine-generating enzyme required for sulfatase activity
VQHEAAAASPQVRLAAGSAIVSNGRRVAFPALLVDVHEVSNQQYRYCVQIQRCIPPDEPADDAHFAKGDRTLPVVWVTAPEAAQFCSWLGRRLPTEPEWERVARGTDGALYPWGNTPPKPDQVNAGVGNRERSSLVPASSAAFRSGDSRDGVEQLIGNAQEWTATQARRPGDQVVLMGNWNGHDRVTGLAVMGSGYLEEAATVAIALDVAGPNIKDGQTGFRCVVTA